MKAITLWPCLVGSGLTAMRERITAVGGQLDVESEPARGTTIAVSVPT